MTEATVPDRRWLVLIAMTGSLSMIFLDSTILGVALPSIQKSLAFDDVTQAWSINGYLMAIAAWIAIGGRIGDWIGRINAFRLGMIGFMLASITCALAPSAWFFVAARVIQGICAGTMQPASAAIVVDIYPATQRGRAMATYAGISLLFMAGGPLIGGALVEYASWSWCFWLNVPIAIISIALTFGLKMQSTRAPTRPIHWPSVALLVSGTPLLIYGLQTLGLTGPTASSGWITTAIGISMLSSFIWLQTKLAQPTIDVRLFRDRAIFGGAFLLFCFQFINVGQGIYGSLYMQHSLHFTPLQAGLGMLPLLIPVLVIIHFAGRMYDRHGPRRPIMIGLCLAFVGSIIETIGVFKCDYPTFAVGMAVLGAGCGFAMSPANADSLARAPAAQRGEASGLVQMMRQFGSTIGIAAMVLVMRSASGDTAPHPGSVDLSAHEIGFGFALHIGVALMALVAGCLFIRGTAPLQLPIKSATQSSTPIT